MSDFILLIKTEALGATHWDLESAADITGVHPELLRYYCDAGLLDTEHAETNENLFFDDDALYQVRRIEHLRRHRGVNLRALPFVLKLLRELEQMDARLRGSDGR